MDQLVVSDEEVIEDAKFINDRFCAYHPALRIGHLPYITKVKQTLEGKTQFIRKNTPDKVKHTS